MLATRRDADREHALEEDHPLRSQSAAALLQFAENGCKLRDPEVPSFGRKHENRGPTTSAQTDNYNSNPIVLDHVKIEIYYLNYITLDGYLEISSYR
ncbi:hypothetical protein RUM44_001650 [Polyplax serrata]|uniref:Uncharacterized protein n=1 Tax=Polyplax serrata TaxID=468196 RepID=A0ABR1AME5_POLSC